MNIRSSDVHIDKVWFVFGRDGQKVSTFPPEDKTGSIKMNRERHIPKVNVTRLKQSRLCGAFAYDETVKKCVFDLSIFKE